MRRKQAEQDCVEEEITRRALRVESAEKSEEEREGGEGGEEVEGTEGA